MPEVNGIKAGGVIRAGKEVLDCFRGRIVGAGWAVG
jgi:hypothetical protein